MTNFALISDVHSQAHLLKQAIEYANQHNLRILFLGDLFDSRIENSDSSEVYHMVKNEIENNSAICIQSNHQNKLLRFLKGNNVFVGDDLQRTLDDFKNSNISLDEVYEFLNSMPYGVVFQDKNNIEYRVAHAYFSSRIQVPEYEDHCLIYEDKLNRSTKSTMLYGPVDKSEGKRVEWWKNNKNFNYVLVSGHYHTTFINENCLVLDPECGSPDGALGLYDVNSKILKKFYDI
jgi:predicted phosphodiesterase